MNNWLFFRTAAGRVYLTLHIAFHRCNRAMVQWPSYVFCLVPVIDLCYMSIVHIPAQQPSCHILHCKCGLLRCHIHHLCNVVLLFTARCTLVQSAVLRSHVVRLSVTLVNCDHIGWNSSKIISPLVSLGCSLFATPTWRVCSKGNTPKFWPKVTHPLLIWASETFDRKLRPNGYR